MLEFAYPFLLLLIVLPLLVIGFLPPYRQRVSAIRVPFFDSVTRAAGANVGEGSVVRSRSSIQTILLWIAWSLIVIGLAKPQWLGEPIVRQEAARDIMLAVDLSGSMDYVDFEDDAGNLLRRLDAVKGVIDEFVATRSEDRIGLIVFGNRAFLQLPFTRDLETAREMVRLTEVGIAGPKTAIGDAIGLAIRNFDESQIEERLMILLTDGNDTASKMTPVNAAAIARDNGVEIYTIGVGNPEATGEDRVDFTALQDIATRTGGEFFDADSTESLRAVYQRIDEMVPAEAKTLSWRPKLSMVHYPLGLALVLGMMVLMNHVVRHR